MADIRCPLQEAFQISPEESALVTSEGVMNYVELDRWVEATRGALLAEGIGPGSRVAVCQPNGWRYVMLIPALWRIGAVVCPLDPKLPPFMLEERIVQMRCGVLVTEDGEPPCAVSGEVMCLASDRIVCSYSPVDETPPIKALSLGQPASMVWTSGSGGDPKAVVHSIGNHYYSALGSNRHLRFRSGQSWLLSLPLYHVGGLGILFRCFLAGSSIVVPDPEETLVESLEQYESTHVSLVSTQLVRLMDLRPEGKEDLPTQVVLVGGGPLPRGLLEESQKAGWPVLATYGLTEMTSQVATVEPHAPPDKRFSAGSLLPYRELSIGEDGEILVRGNTCCLGYWTSEGMIEPFDEGGWFETGDIGFLDEEGFLHIRGRKDNMFVSGGENIHPEEIEQALCNLPGVEDAVVVPVPHREYGYRPVAFVKPRTDDFDWNASGDFLEGVLPRFKTPEFYYPWPAENESDLKVDRRKFCELALQEIPSQ